MSNLQREKMFNKYVENARFRSLLKLVPFIDHMRDVMIAFYTGSTNNMRMRDEFQTNQYRPIWNLLSGNKGLPLRLIEDNIDANWNWMHYLGDLPSLTWDFIKKHKDKPWRMCSLSRNPCITWEIVKETQNEWDWEFDALSANPNITYDIIRQNPSYDWSYIDFGWNPNLTWDIFKQTINGNIEERIGIDWWSISSHDCITWDIVKDNLDFSWCWSNLTCNEKISWQVIKENWDDYPWDEAELSSKSTVTWEDIKNNPYINWNYRNASWNPNLTIDIIRNNNILYWRWYTLSQNRAFSWKCIKNNLDLKWDADGICLNTKIFDVKKEVETKIRNMYVFGAFNDVLFKKCYRRFVTR